MNPSVSIVIPVYNAAKYICLDSVLRQTFEIVEAIVIDDGSRDSSRDIIQKYAAKDDRIIPAFQKNAEIVLGLFLMGKVLSLRA
ncbi:MULTISPECIES: glycosyltransferase family 2 protein [Bacillus]|uniref:glycosyltransferase family 2 protein n=1 Tax=Bacillus TaxID=1386 RepID=UPI002243803E|nr:MULTISPECIES: glycosyltransferase family 2 protein [Bacillus]MDN5389468.1 glycosyltransferase family A protein [Bacillus sp. LB7]MEC1021422.1 glycosyltransferase family 2 protein [Bacillus paralicheniformis]MEC1028037.1 glycosyltransferase family 2 protein [Bacillus paralicheniformis]MEC1037163.1 glycosyltransferase family 2 protein [Bacillus paralicheniformis]MEC1053505.1 glycosyltransferase family 2 protein [Bacillus paralicheniformis]